MHCYLFTHVQKAITLDTAAMSPNSFWNCFTVMVCLKWWFVSIQAGNRCACIVVESHTTLRKVVICTEESTLFLEFSLNPKHFMWVRTTSRCRTAIEYTMPWSHNGARAASIHFVKVTRLGQKVEPNTGNLHPQKKTWGNFGVGKGWIYGSTCPLDPVLRPDLSHDELNRKHLEPPEYGSIDADLKWDTTPYPSSKL